MTKVYFTTFILILVFIFAAVGMNAQDRSLMRRQSVGMSGMAISAQAPGNGFSYAVQSSTGQASPIGSHRGERFILRQGFIQPLQLGSRAERQESLKASVYPNPFTEVVQVLLSRSAAYSVQVFDPSGRILFSNHYLASTEARIDLSQYSSGMYLLRVASAGQYFTERIIKL